MANEQRSPLQNGREATLGAYLELLRGPNVLTAMADVAMGFLFVHVAWTTTGVWLLGLLLAASSLLYASGVVLNDLFDFEIDSRQRPERPLPSGRIPLPAARRLGWTLLLSGLVPAWGCALLAGNLRPGMVAGLLAGCILLYDAYLKRTPLGPPLMGGCRMLNVLLGMSVATTAWQTADWLVAGGIGTYVAGVTWFARTEAQRSSRLHLALATAVMMLGFALVASFPWWTSSLRPLIERQPIRWDVLMVIVTAVIGWRCLRAVIQPSPDRVQSVVMLCILWLAVIDAAVCYVTRGAVWAVAILLLLLPATLLSRWIRLT
jgi:hypothetical protein